MRYLEESISQETGSRRVIARGWGRKEEWGVMV